ncbi:M48 family metalloprotease [Halanaerobacter jeridensis]|uniref:STE24 endopeptidase n=1 Tax=Halanaerobacter jeridensis TaxID=706427 RepID=A0A938XQ19_9FIRM|nr:M48 family metalloprotease [Halanaerobacter jeridensis]MBM7555434.1 STE24 endopeptidase [Halanaerobacter jeridensis]
MKDVYEQKRRKLAQEYNQSKDRYRTYKLIFNFLFCFGFIFFALEQKIYQELITKLPFLDLKLLTFIIIIYAIYSSLDWTLNYFLFYQLEQEYNLSNQSGSEWLIDKLKMSVLSILFLYIAARAFLIFSSYYSDLWWIGFALAGVLFTVVLNFLFPVVIFPMFFELTPYPDTPLRDRLMNLFATADVEVADIYEFDLSSKRNSANAAVMGMGQTRKIILGDNLTEKYSNDEIEAVLAHEIAHHAYNDIFKLLFLQLGSLLITTFILSTFWQSLVDYLGYSNPYGIVVLPLFMITLGFLSWLLSPVELYLQRKTEEAADDFALHLIEEPSKLGTALAKLADESLVELKPSLYKLLFKASHPPIDKRVEKALQWAEEKE